ncbi:MFS transporter [Bacillus sp. B15-48]|uniref:MFS transporter n=1 Tax=Bacillus sp. B15-48 TaxID=1548601 RepID=UPI00193EDB84|nr:MFS transporter [Bacillus sp. B15-48]MBM4763693.1 MFS transporter [Bacillus sp. B15-48]
MNSSEERLWTKDFILFSVGAFFVGLIFLLTMTTVAEYVLSKLDATKGSAGLASGIFVIGLLIARLFTGKYLEVIGRKKLLIFGVTFSFVISLLYFPAENLHFLIAVRLLHGLVVGVVLTVLQTAVLDIIPKARKGEGISYFSLGFILASALGPFLGVIIMQYANIMWIFILVTIVSGLNIMIAFLINIKETHITKEQLNELKGFHLKDFFDKAAIPISFIMFINAFAYSGILSFLASYSKEIQLMSAASFFFIIYSIAIFLSRPFTGKLLDTKGDNIVFYPAILSLSVGLIVLSQAAHGVILLIGAALIGFGYGNLLSAGQAIVAKKTPNYRIGVATTTYFFGIEIAIGIGPTFLGFFVSAFGFRSMYLILGIIVFISLILYYFVHGKNQSYEKPVSQTSEHNSV